MQRDFWTRLKSRKFLSAVLYALFVFCVEVMGWPVSFEAYAAIGAVLGVWVAGESYVDGKPAEFPQFIEVERIEE